ncbi:MAG TPA: choice-of-anchor R domain-containing protein [Chthoniobacterales bacterium]
MKLLRRVAQSCAAISFVTAAFANADTIFSSMPPRTSPNAGGMVIGASRGNTQSLADPFIPSHDFILNGASVAVLRNSGTAALNIAVWSDLNGKPGAALETAMFPAASVSRNAYPPTIASVRFSFGTRLDAGTTYWLVVSTATGTDYCWLDSALVAWRGQRNNEGWTSSGPPRGHAFEVIGQAVR